MPHGSKTVLSRNYVTVQSRKHYLSLSTFYVNQFFFMISDCVAFRKKNIGYKLWVYLKIET